jgi:hypothetical protein
MEAAAMTLDEMYHQTLQYMEQTLGGLAARVPQNKAIRPREFFVMRYQECGVHQALVQQLARVVSGLHAARCSGLIVSSRNTERYSVR